MNIILTVGDIYGIGFEVLIKALTFNPILFNSNKFSIVANTNILEKLINIYAKIEKTNNTNEKTWQNCKISSNLLIINEKYFVNIIEIKNSKFKKIEIQLANELNDFINEDITQNIFGKISQNAGIFAFNSIIEATELVITKQFDAIVTLPVSKEAIHISEKNFIGHTETIANLCNSHLFNRKKNSALMILFSDNLQVRSINVHNINNNLNNFDNTFNNNLNGNRSKSIRVALATTHIPIHSVSKRITSKKLRLLIKKFNNSLKNDFGIEFPSIAVLGLNPHSSDNSMFGNEEAKIILPAIEVMKRKGINVFGAFAADGFFGNRTYLNFDGVIAMYHDQGLIPLKMLANGGVNFTANLQIVRTSPAHGTAFEISGKNIANPQSMLDAINAAITISGNRQ
jgi:4-hydroxy-L-threonine phosphate dehydrogenase PdxA